MVDAEYWHAELPRALELLSLSAAIGLLAGAVEGVCLYYLQASQWSGETIDCLLVPQGILCVSPIADMVFFVALGFLAAGICRLSRGRISGKFVLFLLLIALIFDWLAIAFDLVMDPPYIAILSAGISAELTRRLWKRRSGLIVAARRTCWVLAPAVVFAGILLLVQDNRAAAAAAENLPPAPSAGANVLIVVMDTVRADHFSSLGYGRSTTPNLDRLAAGGVLFENAMSTSSWTLPAHASILTGRFPFEHGAEVKRYDGRYPTLPEAFRARGYRTAAFSANTYYFAPPNGLGAGFQHFDGVFTNLGDTVMRTLYGRNLMMAFESLTHSDLPGRKHAELVNARFLDWLKEDSSRPFFVVLNYFDAHDPYLPPSPFRSRFSERPDVGGVLNGWGDREALKRASDVKDEQEAYDGGIAYEDDSIGRLVATLKDGGLANNTLLVVVSDHGEFFGEHGLYLHKNALFMEGIHVPLLLSWPGHLPAGVRVPNPVSIAALPATVMTLLPGQDHIQFPGPPLNSLWYDSAGAGDEPLILSELVASTPAAKGPDATRSESLLNSRWHFLYTRGATPQLFDWKQDPLEQRNLAETSEGRPVVAEMMHCFEGHFSGIRSPGCGIMAAKLNGVQGGSSVGSGAPAAENRGRAQQFSRARGLQPAKSSGARVLGSRSSGRLQKDSERGGYKE